MLSRRDAMAVMPNRPGEVTSVISCRPLILPGLTLVISPLIALMQDQVNNLKARHVAAAAFHSGLSEPERDKMSSILN